MSDWLNKLNESEQEIEFVVDALRSIYCRLKAVGISDKIAQECFEYAQILTATKEKVKEGRDEVCELRFQSALESSNNVFKAVLTGMELAREEK